jgi:hypothetical protein
MTREEGRKEGRFVRKEGRNEGEKGGHQCQRRNKDNPVTCSFYSIFFSELFLIPPIGHQKPVHLPLVMWHC